MNDLTDFVRLSPWFIDLPSDAIDRLCAPARLRDLEAGKHLFRVGDSPKDVYGLLTGQVRISLSSAQGREFVVVDVNPNTWLGEAAIIGEDVRVLNAIAREDCKIVSIPAQTVREVAQDYPVIYRQLFVELNARTRNTFKLLSGILFFPLRARLAARLLQLTKEHGRTDSDGIHLDVKLTQNDFAMLSMGSRQRINKIFREWVDQGTLVMSHDRYIIANVTALRSEMELKDDGL